MKRIILSITVFALLCIAGVLQADVTNMGTGLTSLLTVTVGNPGNSGEISGNGGWAGPIRVCGQVNYTYKISKYEVTAAQYTTFLNAVAKTDTYGLYNTNMNRSAGQEGCGIVRSGVSGSYTYSVLNNSSGYLANRPVNFVSWVDGARFCNWLHNGQGVANTVAQAYALTEDGAYALNGKTINADLITVSRKSGAKWAIPTEDEWYKAAYHKNDGVTGNYWDYPTKSSSIPGRSYSGTNDANWIDSVAPYNTYLETYYYRNKVGEFINSPSPYGTFDQGGNVYERNETIGLMSDGITLNRGIRGGSYRSTGSHLMLADARDFMYNQDFEWQGIGFRVIADPGIIEGGVQIGEHRVLNVNGEPFLPIGYMGVGINDMEAIAQTGSNTIHSYNAYYFTPQESTAYMAEASRLNLKVVLPPWGSSADCSRTTTSLASDEIIRMTDMVNLYKNHPNFLAWYMSDEPEAVGIPASRLVQAYQLVKSLDPNHPCIMLNDSILGIQTYKGAADIMMPDPYCQPTTTGLTRDMSLVAGFMDQIGLVDPNFVAMACIQAFDYGEDRENLYTDRAATLDEFRSMTWIAINHGGKGFINFAWPYTFNYPDLYLGIPYVIKEVNALSGVVLSPDMRPVIGEGWNFGLDASVVAYNGASWVIVVNTLNQPRDFTLIIPELGNLQLNVVGEDITRQASNGSLTDTLQNYQTRIYTTANPNFNLRKETVKTSIAALEAAKRKPGNFAFWMDNGTIVSASSWIGGARFTTPRGVTNGVIYDDEGWKDNTSGFDDWIQLTWPVTKVVGKVVLYSHNLRNFEVQYLSSGNWITLQSYVGDSAHQLQSVITFSPVSTTSIRVLVHSAFEANSRISEIECYSDGNYTNPDVFQMGNGFTSLETVTVANPGNAGELAGNDSWAGFKKQNTGKVDYIYKIGKYEVTAAQYTVFLNSVAKTDTYGLYNTAMQTNAEGCQIYRNGVSGSYTYAVGNDWANRPVNFVSWGDSARFVNWLHNGQPTGAQNNTTTEDGAYSLNGKTTNADMLTVTRKSGWKWALPTEDEWYKAAFHKNDGVTGNFWDYPMQSNSSVLPGRSYSGANDANWIGSSPNNTYIESYYCRSLAGQFINSPSAYGTFDQGGNVWERNETIVQIGYPSSPGAMAFGIRGSGYKSTGEYLMWALNRNPTYLPDYEWQGIGFRVAAQVFGRILTGKVNLSNYDADITQVPVTIALGNGLDLITLNLVSDGGFTIYDVPDGIYDISIKASHWLSKTSYGFEVYGNFDIGIVTLINGDVVDNNEVDFDDINVTRAAYGSFPGDGNWNERADVDGSGEVDFTDINIVRGNYGEIGD